MTKTITMMCTTCGGSGGAAGGGPKKCPNCNGRGTVRWLKIESKEASSDEQR